MRPRGVVDVRTDEDDIALESMSSQELLLQLARLRIRHQSVNLEALDSMQATLEVIKKNTKASPLITDTLLRCTHREPSHGSHGYLKL